MANKPIKRNENILKLSKEHHFSLLFCWKIKQGLNGEIPTGRIIKYVQYFSTHFLVPHFREEELFLFSTLNDEKVDKAIEQHKDINNLYSRLLIYNESQSIKALQKIYELVYDHVRLEELELFPYIENKLSNEQLTSIGKN